MKCKCRDNKIFPQFKVEAIYSYRYTDKYEYKVIVTTDSGDDVTMDKGSFLFTFDIVPERYRRKDPGNFDYDDYDDDYDDDDYDEYGDYKEPDIPDFSVDPFRVLKNR